MLAVEVSGVSQVQLVARGGLDLLAIKVLHLKAYPQQGVQFCADNQHLTAVFSTSVA